MTCSEEAATALLRSQGQSRHPIIMNMNLACIDDIRRIMLKIFFTITIITIPGKAVKHAAVSAVTFALTNPSPIT
jgi:hypothetical protein